MSVQPETQTKDEVMEELWTIKDTLASSSENDLEKLVKKVKGNDTSEFQFMQISDTETYEYGEWIDNLKEYIRNETPAFMVHTGDICYEPGLQFHSEFINSE